MAIQMRRGEYDDFDASKMLAGELAVVVSGDPETEGGALYVATAAGSATRVAFADEVPTEDATTTSDGLMSAADKAKLDGVAAGAQANVIESINVNGTAVDVNNKNAAISIPQASSDSAGLMTASDKAKLDGIEAGANAYTLPAATTAALGGVKPDGTTVTVDADGTIHSAGGSGSGYNPSLSVGRADALTGADGTAQWAQRTTEGSGTATVRSVQGAAVAWGQLSSFQSKLTNGGVSFTEGTRIISGNKYLLKAKATVGSGTASLTVFCNNGSNVSQGGISASSDGYVASIFTATIDGTSNGSSSGAQGNAWMYATIGTGTTGFDDIQLFNLTQMFGSGSEPSTVAEFECMYPEAYYPYSAPTLKPVTIAGIASTDANGNALDGVEWETQTLRAAGSVRDELTSGELVTRVGVVDLGTLDWSYLSSNSVFYATISDMRPYVDSSSYAGLSCAKYAVGDPVGISYQGIADGSLHQRQSATDAQNVLIKDTTYTTAADFKAAMSGVMLFYELATPTTTPISPALDMTYRVEQGGTEAIIVPDGEVSAAPVLTIAEGESAAELVMDALACIAAPDGPVATANHAVNTYLTMQGKLYKVTRAIAVGESIVAGTNVTETTVMAEVLSLIQ